MSINEELELLIALCMHAKGKDSDVMNVSFTLMVQLKVSLCLNMHGVIKSGGIALGILNLGSTVVSFLVGMVSRYPLSRRLGGLPEPV
jgi:hypothetical protein